MRKWWPLVAISLGTFMLLVDVTIVNVALPDMTLDLHTSFSSLQWVIDAYALALASTLMGIGAIGDAVGHRKIYLIGLAIFAVSSLVCGISPNTGVLITARTVQGLGAAAMFATTFALLSSSYSGRDRGAAYGIWGAISGVSAALGPIVGGVLTESLSWRWIFFVNLPISVAAIALTLKVLPVGRPSRERRIDFVGMFVFTVGAAALTFAMIRSSDDGWISAPVLSLLAGGVIAWAIFAVLERRIANPLLDLTLFRNRVFSGIVLAALAMNFAAFAYFTYTSVWLQSLLGLSPIQAGLTGLPLSASTFLVSALIGRFLHKSSPGLIIGGGLMLIGVGALLSALLVDRNSSWPALVAGFAVCGIGVGLALPTLSSAAMSTVTPERAGMAAGAVNTARQLGFAFGIAVLGSVFTARAAHDLRQSSVPRPSEVASALAGGQTQRVIASAPADRRGQLDSAVHGAFASGLDAAFLVSGAVGVAIGLIVIVLMRAGRAEPVVAGSATPPAAARSRA